MFNENLKKRRKQLNISLLELAEMVGVTESTMQRYESGVIKNIPYDKIEQISKALKCSPSYLMGWSAELDNSEEALKLFNQLSEENKKDILKYMYLMIKANQED